MAVPFQKSWFRLCQEPLASYIPDSWNVAQSQLEDWPKQACNWVKITYSVEWGQEGQLPPALFLKKCMFPIHFNRLGSPTFLHRGGGYGCDWKWPLHFEIASYPHVKSICVHLTPGSEWFRLMYIYHLMNSSCSYGMHYAHWALGSWSNGDSRSAVFFFFTPSGQ